MDRKLHTFLWPFIVMAVCFFTTSVQAQGNCNSDNQRPRITCPPTQTVQCASQVPQAPGNNVSFRNAGGTVSDNCTAEGNIIVRKEGNDVISNQTCANRFTITRTFRATDAAGNSSTCTQTIIVNDNTPPTITCPPPITVQCASQVPAPNTGAVTATDNCGGTVTVTHVGDAISNQTCANRYTITRTFRATDACGNTATCTQTIIVNDITPPVITSIPANVKVQCASEVPAANTGAVQATDNCNGRVTVSSTDVVTPGTCPNRFTIARTYTATDECGNTSFRVQTITVDDQTAPKITAIPANVTVSCASEVPAPDIAAVEATDNCAGPIIITSNDVRTDGDCPNRFTIARTFTATDACGNETSQVQTITVDDQTAPEITAIPANITVSCAANVPAADNAAVVATDNCGGPVTVTHKDVVTSGSCRNRFVIARTFTATDECGNAASQTQTIIVDDQIAPRIISVPANITVSCAADVPAADNAAVEATDNCGGAVTVTSNDVVTPGTCANRFVVVRTFTVTDECGNTSTGIQTIIVNDVTPPAITQGTIESCYQTREAAEAAAIAATQAKDNCGGTVIRTAETVGECAAVITVTATDACGNFSTVIYNTRIDNTAPVILNCPADITVNTGPGRSTCDQEVLFVEPTATDNCGGELTYTSRTHAPGSVFPVGNTVVTYTFRDQCGNTSTCSFTVTVVDNTAPVFEDCPADITLSACEDKAMWTAPTASDNCPGVKVTQTAGPAPGSKIANGSNQTVTYTAEDASGNKATCSFNISRAQTLVATCSTSNSQLYFGLTDYQTAVITGTATGGTGPYTITIAMNRPLECNSVDNAGDETFVGIGGRTTNGNCLTGSTNEAPVATMTNAVAGVPFAVNATLLKGATFTITVTDANGCTATCTVTVNAEDVRCFPGRSDIRKVTVCHRTNSLTNPCVTICVDESSVATHLAHGDYLGECNETCTPPVPATTRTQKGTGADEKAPGETPANKLVVTATPNPSSGHFTLRIQSVSAQHLRVRVLDMLGRVVETKSNIAANSVFTIGSTYRPGAYFVEVIQGAEKQTLRLLKH